MEARDSRGALEPYFSCTGEEGRDRLALGIPHLDYIIYSYYINNQNGTDGRRMIRKTPSVTGRHGRPLVHSLFFDVLLSAVYSRTDIRSSQHRCRQAGNHVLLLLSSSDADTKPRME